MAVIACQCGTRLKRSEDPGVSRAVCPACGVVIQFDALPMLQLDDSAPQFEAVNLDVGSVNCPSGAHLSTTIRIEDTGRGYVYVCTSEKGRSFQTLVMSIEDFGRVTELVQKTNNAINHLHAPGRVRGIFRGTRDG